MLYSAQFISLCFPQGHAMLPVLSGVEAAAFGCGTMKGDFY